MSLPPPYSENRLPYPPAPNQGGNYNSPPYPPPHSYPVPPSQVPYGYGLPSPISHQPTALPPGQFGPTDGWMNITQVPLNCPPGLQYLVSIDQLFIKQKVELLEAFIGFETNNKYTIKNSQGQKIFYAVEENDCCTRNCCGPMRSFDIRVLDHMKNEVIRMKRDFACDSCWFPCCLQKLEVYAPSGYLVGTVEQTWSLCTPEFDVKNESGHTVLKLEGPVCRYGVCGNVEFKVLSVDKSTVVGRISKQWSGLMRELFTDTDYFGISFPLDLDVRMKAVMLGACFLIDFMYFEKQGSEENDCFGNF